jgi:cell division protein FtsN
MTAFIFRLTGIVMLCGLFILSAGCGGAIQSATPPGGAEVEIIDPFNYGDEFASARDEVIPEDFTNDMLEMRQQEMEIEAETRVMSQRSGDTSIPQEETVDEAEYCYRVQIGIFPDRAQAQKTQEYAKKRVDMDVVVTYDDPFYRVRVGEFETEEEANDCVTLLKGKGFPDSRRIKTKLNGL